MPKTVSYVKNGRTFFKRTGRYNEVILEAKNSVKNDAPSALNQKNLAPKGNNTAASITLKELENEIG